MPEKIIIYTDGGSRGNPGPAAAGFVIADTKGDTLSEKAFFLGKATNNIAEYTAVVKALEEAKGLEAKNVTVYSDSELLVKQIQGQYKVKNENIRPLYRQVLDLFEEYGTANIYHVPREQNTHADGLVNRALDRERDIEEKSAGKKAKRGKPVRLGFLISGSGRTLLNVIECIKDGTLNSEIPIVISSRSTVVGVERAKAAGLKVVIIRKKDYPDIEQFSRRIEEELVAADVELVIQAGWLCLWRIPDKYINRVMNIHPALLPSFGGKGMWGHHVHEAVLQAGCKVSGCTVHFCTNEYDKGPIIIQRCCAVNEDDTADTLAARVFKQECIAYPQAIKLFAEGTLHVEGSNVEIRK